MNVGGRHVTRDMTSPWRPTRPRCFDAAPSERRSLAHSLVPTINAASQQSAARYAAWSPADQ